MTYAVLVSRPRANAKMIAELAQQARFPAIFQRRETKDAFPRCRFDCSCRDRFVCGLCSCFASTWLDQTRNLRGNSTPHPAPGSRLAEAGPVQLVDRSPIWNGA